MTSEDASAQPDPPRAEKIPRSVTLHGRTREDPYHWLRDDAWQTVMREPETLRPDVREHLLRENAHTQAVLKPTENLREVLFSELKGRLREDESSVPAKDGQFEYYVRYEMGGQHPRYCRRPAGNEPPRALVTGETYPDEEVLFDANAAAKNHAYFSTGGVTHSRDHRLLCVGVDTKGSEYYELSFKDLEAGKALPDRIENTSGGASFASDGRTVFYVAVDDNHRPSKVMSHRLGTPTSKDRLVYEEPDPGFFVSVGLSEDYRHVVISSHDHTTSEVWLIDSSTPEQPPRRVAERRAGVEYDVSPMGDSLLILTNDGAEDFKLVTAPMDDPGPENWRDLVPHRPGCLIVSVTTFRGHAVRLEVSDALPRIVIRELDGGEEHTIAFEEEAYSLGLVSSYEFDTSTLRFSYSSPTTPSRTFDYDMKQRTRRLLKEQEVPSGHDPACFRSARIVAESHDGERVPVTLLWHRDTPIDGSAPVLLYGYGSYGHSIPASFSENRLSLVQRGFIYAIGHVRGGKERGYGWYTHGKLMEKRNTFLDFIACAEHLVATGYTSSGNVTIFGGSAGGMLVGAAANLRPELFKAVVGQVPFVDVLSTMCDRDLPLTPPEWPEWGNPLESVEAYDYIASYSPYDNVERKDYPHVLATAGLTDPRVTYWEPAKWIARLRELKTNDTLSLLHTYMEAGHGGAAGRFERLEEVALVYAFILLANQCIEAPLLPAR